MRTIRYVAAARNDLLSLYSYYASIDPDIAARVFADIDRAIELLLENPRMGRPVRGRRLRGKLSSRYRFKIIYRVRRDVIEIQGIYRYQNRSP